MPILYEGSEITGALLPEVTKTQGMVAVSVIAGGSDNAAGVVGVRVANTNQAMLSLGMPGIHFAVSGEFSSKPESAVHSFYHALPQRWHLMSVMLSTAPCLNQAVKLTSLSNVPALITAAQQADENVKPVWFLPYPPGKRIPHGNPQAEGGLFDLTRQYGPNELVRAMLEGAGHTLADGMGVVHAYGVKPQSVALIGDEACSEYQCQVLADISGQQLDYRAGGDMGPVLDTVRLTQIAADPEKSLIESLP